MMLQGGISRVKKKPFFKPFYLRYNPVITGLKRYNLNGFLVIFFSTFICYFKKIFDEKRQKTLLSVKKFSFRNDAQKFQKTLKFKN